MANKYWTSNYPANLDSTINMPSVVNDIDTMLSSQLHSLRDSVQQLESIIGSDNIESNSLRDVVSDLEASGSPAGGAIRYVQYNDDGKFGATKFNLYEYTNNTMLNFTNDDSVMFIASSFGTSYNSKFTIGKARGTEASPSSVLSGDGFGIMRFLGYYNSSSLSDSCGFLAYADENWSGSNKGAVVDLRGTSIGSNSIETKLKIVGNSYCVLGGNNPQSGYGVDSHIEIIADIGDNNSISSVMGFNNIADDPSGCGFVRGRGTIDSPEAVQKDDWLGYFRMGGHKSSSSFVHYSATLVGVATENWSESASGSKLEFYTTNSGSNNRSLKLTINNDGKIISETMYSGYTIGGTNKDIYIDDNGVIGVISSSEKFKENIVNMENTDWIDNLRPVNFEYINSPGQKQYGLIAEEVEVINSDLVTYDGEGNVDGVTYTKLIPILLNEIQKLEQEVDLLESVGG